MKMLLNLQKFMRDERGVTSIEYALIKVDPIVKTIMYRV